LEVVPRNIPEEWRPQLHPGGIPKHRIMKNSPTLIIFAVRRIGILILGRGMMSQQIREMKIQNWSKMAMNREEGKRIVEKAKTHRVVAAREEQGSCQQAIFSHTILNILRHFVKERFMSTSNCFGPPK
jgi:hypothetical protein